MMRELWARILQPEEFCKRLAETGRRASLTSAAEMPWLEQSWFRKDVCLVAVEGAPYSAVSLMWRGGVGLGQSLANGMNIRVNGFPLKETQIVPLQHHFIIRGAGKAPRTKLRPETKGLLKRERVRLRWEGSLLALKLMADTSLMKKLEGLAIDDTITVDPDPARDVCRVVLQRYMVIKFSVFEQDILQVHRESITDDLLDAIDVIAARTKEAS